MPHASPFSATFSSFSPRLGMSRRHFFPLLVSFLDQSHLFPHNPRKSHTSAACYFLFVRLFDRSSHSGTMPISRWAFSNSATAVCNTTRAILPISRSGEFRGLKCPLPQLAFLVYTYGFSYRAAGRLPSLPPYPPATFRARSLFRTNASPVKIPGICIFFSPLDHLMGTKAQGTFFSCKRSSFARTPFLAFSWPLLFYAKSAHANERPGPPRPSPGLQTF